MNHDLNKLHPYPFEKLASLTADVLPNPELAHISLGIGEPKHPAPGFVAEAIIQNLSGLSTYPTTKGVLALRQAIASWLNDALACWLAVLIQSSTYFPLMEHVKPFLPLLKPPLIANPMPWWFRPTLFTKYTKARPILQVLSLGI
ncbi:LL-diaminopimelate aminotransferase [Nitrincola nitratireducens]|uniref:LL-diaminopimelate aminotransferase n=1 Tax=Nitrincola nitratireducens TaxID=1229521 RepID=W9V598_9GAMM|nr:LL-diaminopimelate aminotransferase [Nitrincola nitratireducens]